ncbi:putative AB5 enterotoxin binding subunit YtxB [Yersinia enterocolitica]|uniref:putative AB5 enterotoxin binding subunit YtxB n=1 Tax=Yersinia enterocolitica TaxID=630 RepID=UPI0028992628|nr:putative AB5 enterotoxin binding subunit YtxB [Yersinia enterocolitica]
MRPSIRLISVFYILFSALTYRVAFADSELKNQCEKDGSTMLYSKSIQAYNASIMWRPSESDNSFNAIAVKVTGKWYGTLAEDRTNGNASMGISSFAQAAYLIGMPVNICVKGKYLRGIEGVD